MPRSATDATRFTSTTPHAFSKPPSSSASFSIPNGSAGTAARLRNQGPLGETPQEKVKRLRAAAQKTRNANISTFEKIILHGRVWADKAHRFTALSLIGLTFICGGVTVYTISDMILWNRRKRAEFFAEQRAAKETALYNARKAVQAGTATVDQIEFVKLQDEHQASLDKAAQEKANKKGVFTRTKELVFSGLKKEEEGEDVGSSEARLGYESLSEEDDALGERESDILRAIEDKKLALQSKAKEAFAKEKERQISGGPLDRLGTVVEGQDIATEVDSKKPSGSWFTFWSNR